MARDKDGQDSFTGGPGRDIISYSNCKSPSCTAEVVINLAGGGGTDAVVGFEDAQGRASTGIGSPGTVGRTRSLAGGSTT